MKLLTHSWLPLWVEQLFALLICLFFFLVKTFTLDEQKFSECAENVLIDHLTLEPVNFFFSLWVFFADHLQRIEIIEGQLVLSGFIFVLSEIVWYQKLKLEDP